MGIPPPAAAPSTSKTNESKPNIGLIYEQTNDKHSSPVLSAMNLLVGLTAAVVMFFDPDTVFDVVLSSSASVDHGHQVALAFRRFVSARTTDSSNDSSIVLAVVPASSCILRTKL